MTGIRLSLWRAVTVFRVAALLVCLVLIGQWLSIYQRPAVALLVGAAMVVVTTALGALAWTGRADRVAIVLADVVVTAGLTFATVAAQTADQHRGGMVTLTTIWAAGPAIEAGIVAGPIAGLAGAAVQYGVAFAVRGSYSGETLYSGIVLAVTGAVVGFVVRYGVRAEAELRVATEARAALAERERLARNIHDGVLQVLGLVSRTGRDEGGRWAAIAEAAAEQENRLRGLITSEPDAGVGARDLSNELRALRSSSVTVSTPAEPVSLPAGETAEIVDAVRAALHNTAAHAGADAHAYVLLEVVGDTVTVTVRDDGAGFEPARLDDAKAAGRIGVARSIRGRIEDLGGRVSITSAPNEGTEIEMAVPLR